MSFPSKDKIEEYVKSVEEFVSSSVTSIADDVAGLPSVIQRFWHDISRFGPPELPALSDLRIPTLESIRLPPPLPPPPPPPPESWFSKPMDWVYRNKKLVGVFGVTAVSVGLAAYFGWAAISGNRKHLKSSSSMPRNRVIGELSSHCPYIKFTYMPSF